MKAELEKINDAAGEVRHVIGGINHTDTEALRDCLYDLAGVVDDLASQIKRLCEKVESSES